MSRKQILAEQRIGRPRDYLDDVVEPKGQGSPGSNVGPQRNTSGVIVERLVQETTRPGASLKQPSRI
jgi:hypothetical protein